MNDATAGPKTNGPSATEQVTPKPAATVLLLRDGPTGLEVFMIVRHRDIDFAGGALVFPGGKVDREDHDVAPEYLDEAALSLDAEARALRVAGVREAFEEVGVLLADPLANAAPLTPDRVARLAVNEGLAMAKDQLAMPEFCAAEQVRVRCGALVPCAHWITPLDRPKRFDTHFFLAALPEGQEARHDGGESIDSLWINPRQAFDDAEAERRTVVFPTRRVLWKLGQNNSVAAALAAARAERIVTVMPETRETPDGRILKIPAEAGYDGSEFLFTGPSSIKPRA